MSALADVTKAAARIGDPGSIASSATNAQTSGVTDGFYGARLPLRLASASRNRLIEIRLWGADIRGGNMSISGEKSPQRRRYPPELDIVLLGFILNFSWELLQAPLYSSMNGIGHFEGIRACLIATIGDVVIALLAFWGAAAIAGSRGWVTRPGLRPTGVFLGIGLAVTVLLEYLNTDILDRWSYGPDMPVLPFVGTGLAPVAQWVILPLILLWYLRRLAPSRVGTDA